MTIRFPGKHSQHWGAEIIEWQVQQACNRKTANAMAGKGLLNFPCLKRLMPLQRKARLVALNGTLSEITELIIVVHISWLSKIVAV